MAEIKDNRLLFVDNYIYYRSREAKSRIYWDCRKARDRKCSVRAMTNDPRPGKDIVLFKGPAWGPNPKFDIGCYAFENPLVQYFTKNTH